MVGIDAHAFKKAEKGYKLQAADIILVHTKRSLWGRLIRWGTHCYWNHALMVCSSGDTEQGHESVLAVDAKTSGAVVICRVSDYLDRSDKYDVAVKRLDARWFQDDSQASALDFRVRVCDIAVNEVDFRIGSRLMESVDQIIRQLTVIFRFIRRKLKQVYTPPNIPWNIRVAEMKAFTCGGFVQWCYYKGVTKMTEERIINQSWLKEITFNPRVKKRPTPFELLTTTPADLANCDKLAWKYVIIGGVVQEVSSIEEAGLVTMRL